MWFFLGEQWLAVFVRGHLVDGISMVLVGDTAQPMQLLSSKEGEGLIRGRGIKPFPWSVIYFDKHGSPLCRYGVGRKRVK